MQGLSAVKLFMVQDDLALATAEYLTYKAEKQAAGQAVLDPLRWHLHLQVGTLDETEQGLQQSARALPGWRESTCRRSYETN